MLRHEESVADIGEYVAHWQWRLPTKRHDLEHRHTLEEFAAWPQLGPIDQEHLSYLSALDEALRGKWLDRWQQVLAVGPFLGLRRRNKSVPIVVVASYDDTDADTRYLSTKLAAAYLEYGILPDIHLLPTFAVQSFEQTRHTRWERTKRVSVHLLRK